MWFNLFIVLLLIDLLLIVDIFSRSFYSFITKFALLYLSLFNITSIEFITYHETRSFDVCFTRSLLTLDCYLLVCSIYHIVVVVFRQFPWFCRTSSHTTCRSWVCSICFGSRMLNSRREPDGSTHPNLPSMFLIRPSLFRVLWQELRIDATVNLRSI